MQAFLNYSVQSQKKAGKNKTRPVYARFDRFYDYKAEQKRAMGEKDAKTEDIKAIKAIMERGQNG